MQNNAVIIKDNCISGIVGGKPFNINSSHPNFQKIRELMGSGDYETEEVMSLIDIPASVEKFSQGNCCIDGSSVLYNGERVHGVIVDRILDFMNEGLNFEPLLRFLERLMKNPSRRAIKELYSFLEHKNMPVDEEGYFYAYKGVGKDFKDLYSGTIDNSVGSKPTMERNKVDDDANVGCSAGLHAGSLDYASGYKSHDGHLVIVKIDPANVVSVPHDCSCQKLRATTYEVVGVFEKPLGDTLYQAPDYDVDLGDEDDEDNWDEWNDDEDDEDY